MNTRIFTGPGIPPDPVDGMEPDNLDHASAVESYADNLMADCKAFNLADRINRDNDLYDGDLLTWMMFAVANWTGSIESSHERMKAMHNLLANELQKIAEREVS